jgi:hypothetical protein
LAGSSCTSQREERLREKDRKVDIQTVISGRGGGRGVGVEPIQTIAKNHGHSNIHTLYGSAAGSHSDVIRGGGGGTLLERGREKRKDGLLSRTFFF